MSLSELARKRAFQNSLLLLPFVEICSSPGGFDRKTGKGTPTVRNRVAIYTTHIYSGCSANASFWNINTIVISIIVMDVALVGGYGDDCNTASSFTRSLLATYPRTHPDKQTHRDKHTQIRLEPLNLSLIAATLLLSPFFTLLYQWANLAD